MIEIQDLTKAFGPLLAVDRISFRAAPGEVLGLLGPNGAGKSTTLKMITGFLAPSAGTARVFGHDVAGAGMQARRLIGYLPEGAPAYADMTPGRFLGFIAELRGYRGAEKRRRVDQAVRDLQLEEVLRQPIGTLSKGYKRRVGLAQAILHRPPLLILDEPTDGLDPNQKHQVRELIQRLGEGRIIIVSTHILEEVGALCSRSLIIARGRLLADATPAELERRSVYHGAVTFKLDDCRAAAERLRAHPSVADVALDFAERAVTAFPAGSADLLVVVERLAAEQGWALREIYRERGRLDDVFRRVTTEGEAA